MRVEWLYLVDAVVRMLVILILFMKMLEKPPILNIIIVL